MKSIFTFFILSFFSNFLFAQNVNIPDANFKNALLAHDPVIDTNSDGEIQVTEAEAITGALNVGSKSISDLTGIEAFVNLTELYCQDNLLTHLNTGSLTDLVILSA